MGRWRPVYISVNGEKTRFKIGDKLNIIVNRDQFKLRTFNTDAPSMMLDERIDNINYKKPAIVVRNFNYSIYDHRVSIPTLSGGVYVWGYSKENMSKVFKTYGSSRRLDRAKAVRKIRNNILIGGKNARRNKTRKGISQGNIN